ncbi:hypothetical protein RT717_19490 [Imperialibacter roseus]|uniref:Outer membrane protein beta-barrel domain-containing protein n=1 Tax=Imperialibacter roseus TaxID=1324217 RepID=A0ABZ0IJR5_9BACT|nr:hypothetical protein [Imperialibacter roseus]WOK05267.1 hypothetical protein RT717_19490 [Imperialibacter roseus]
MAKENNLQESPRLQPSTPAQTRLTLLSLLFVLLAGAKAFAQADVSYVIKAAGSFHSSYKDFFDLNPYYPVSIGSQMGSKTIVSTYGIGVAKRINDHFFGGIAFSQTVNSEEINPKKDIPSYGSYGFYLDQYSNQKQSITATSPDAFVQNNYLIAGGFYAVLDLYVGYMWMAEKRSGTGYTITEIDGGLYGTKGSYYRKQTREYMKTALMPSLRYNFHKNMGVDVSLGLFQFRKKVKESIISNAERRASYFDASISPDVWQFGFWMGF